jgi:uncharacterized protein
VPYRLTCILTVGTIITMRIEFDAAKDKRNRKKHGLSLGFATELDWDSMQVEPDDSQDYGEERWIGIAPKGNRLYTVVFTVRDEADSADEVIRPISLRRASNSEVEIYERKTRP